MNADPIGTIQALTAAIETPWGTYAPGNLVTLHSGTELGWIIDLDPLPNMIGLPHRVEVPAAALTIWHNSVAHASKTPLKPLGDDVMVPADLLARLYLGAGIDDQIAADITLGPRLIDHAIAQHDARKAA